MTREPTTPPLFVEQIRETHLPHFLLALATGSLIPAAILAPGFQWLSGPDFAGTRGLLTCFQVLAVLFGIVVAVALCLWPKQPTPGYLERLLHRIVVLEHGVELRDGDDALLGSTADGTLQLVRINMHLGRQMYSAVSLRHRGGRLALLSRPLVAPWPGQPAMAQVGRWHELDHARYEVLLRFAS